MLIPQNIASLTAPELEKLFSSNINEDLLISQLTKTQIDELKHVASIQDKLRIQNFDRSVLEQILIKRFFLAPSFQIYGGIAGLFDYGPPGCALQSNILNLWRLHFCLEEDMLELECTNLTPEIVLKVSSWILLVSR
jgi:hypothetical protein